MKIKVWVQTNNAGSRCEKIIDVEEPVSGEEVLDYIEESMIDWGWKHIDEETGAEK